ncbi:GntR family transcriptional regulator [Bradyrhizobium sp. CW9]|nr:GntR family transcriptional regulator [Bradyrhizobium sp. CW9]
MLSRLSDWGTMRPTTTLHRIDRQLSLGELAYSALKEAMLRGQFLAGQKLTVRTVAQALSISTTPARDAIMRLIGEGLLVNAGPKTVIVPSLSLAALNEVTSIRLSLERLAAGVAAERMASDSVEALKRLQLRSTTTLGPPNGTAALMADKAFHFLVYETAQMPRLVTMIDSLWMRIWPLLGEHNSKVDERRADAVNHMEAIAGLESRDKARVQAAIEKDIKDGYHRLVKRIKQHQT